MPYLAAAGIQAGSQLASSLFGWLGGRGEQKRLQGNYNKSRSMLLGDLGKDIFDPEQALSLFDAQSLPQFQEGGRQIQKATGNVNAADAMGALWEKNIAGRQGLYNDLFLKNVLGKAERDQNIKSQLFSSDAAALAAY